MKIILAFFLGISNFTFGQYINKHTDTLIISKADSVFTISFQLTKVPLGSTAKVTFTSIDCEEIIANKDFVILNPNPDPEFIKTITVKATNEEGEFKIKVRGNIKEYMCLAFSTHIVDEPIDRISFLRIVLKPKELQKPAVKEIVKDPMKFEIRDSIDIPLYKAKDTPATRLEDYQRVPETRYIDSVLIETQTDSRIIVLATIWDSKKKMEKYFNYTPITLKWIWTEEDKIYLNGDSTKPFFYLRDFLDCKIDNKNIISTELNSKNSTNKLSAPKKN